MTTPGQGEGKADTLKLPCQSSESSLKRDETDGGRGKGNREKGGRTETERIAN